MVRSYALGREFTIVATYPYEGPSEDVARKLMEEEAIRLDMMRLEEEQERTIATQSQAKGDETVGSGDEADGASAAGGAAGGPKGPAPLLDKGMDSQKTRL